MPVLLFFARPIGPFLSLLLVMGFGAVRANAQEFPPQSEHRAGFSPVPEEVFDVLTQFYDYDRGIPLAPRVVEGWEEGGVRYEKVVFTTQSGERVPGELALPRSPGPWPVVILLHGLGNSKDRWWEEDRIALRQSLLEAGVGVYAFDLRFHGERSAANDYLNPVYLTLGDSLFTRNRDMIIDSAIDTRRALDYLESRPDVDPDRLAVVGYSMGGLIALYLAALEPRLAAIVGCAVPTTESPLPTDGFQFATRATVPGLLLIGEEDWLSSPADARRLRELLPGGSELTVYPGAGHTLPPAFAGDAAEWLIGRLR